MRMLKKYIDNKRYRMPRKLKRNGFLTVRFFFTGFGTIGNERRKFFIEVTQLNPGLSSTEPVHSVGSPVRINESALQQALAGTAAVEDVIQVEKKQPSYAAVRVGILGKGAKQICRYYAPKAITISPKVFYVGTEDCTFTNELLEGRVQRSESEVTLHPEYFSAAGKAAWNISYDIPHNNAQFGYRNKSDMWIPVGGAADFSGTILFDGSEYRVSPKTCAGVIDVSYGKTYPLPLVTMASSYMTSLISGKRQELDYFAVHGEYDGAVALVAKFAQNIFTFLPSKKKHLTNHWHCVLVPEDGTGEKLHWSVSVSDRKWIIDVDIFCLTKELTMREFELPEGNRKSLQVLTGGTGAGEIRLYRRWKKSIELIEHARIENTLCEYGRDEDAI